MSHFSDDAYRRITAMTALATIAALVHEYLPRFLRYLPAVPG